MRINFLSFLNPYKFNGGGELDNRMLIEEGRRLGHDIKIVSRVNNKYLNRIFQPHYNYHENPDIWILSDLFNVPEYNLKYPVNFIEDIIENYNYVHIDNAYVDICSKPALPCHGDKNKCVKNCGNTISQKIYENSLANFFLSPLHANIINGLMDNKFLLKSKIIRPLIDISKFHFDTNTNRDIDYIYVGTISNYKGYQNIKNKYKNCSSFLFIGKNATNEILFGKHIEYVPNYGLVKYLARAKNFVHLPEWKEPMGRTVIEAALCGCNIISNENVGACSFDFDLSNSENYKNSSFEFWENIHELKKNIC